ncbi:MAG TPA: hypothetical protein VMC06_09515, partial [Opitutaceae bacterium]|nr:hypothetical protein [Opitutaceae bacterium]
MNGSIQSIELRCSGVDPGATPRPLSWREKISYGVADMGFNFYWANIATFLMIFYTDTFGISAAAAGSIVLAGADQLWRRRYGLQFLLGQYRHVPDDFLHGRVRHLRRSRGHDAVSDQNHQRDYRPHLRR